MTLSFTSKLQKIIKQGVVIAVVTALFVSPVFWLARSASAATPAYKQGAEVKINSGGTISKAFSSANVSGNLIVAYVIWSNTTATVNVSDSRNTYTAAGPIVKFDGNKQSAQVFYAKNIGAGSNTVTATFSATLSGYSLLYIHEFSGLDKTNPLDVNTANFGTASPASTGNLTTTNANDLLFAAGAAVNNLSAIGPSFTAARTYDGNRTAYKNVTTAGNYTASASVSGNWEMSLVAFKADAGTPADTTAPSVPNSLIATAVSEKQVNLSWAPSTDNVGVTGYKVFRNGTQVSTATTTAYSDTNLAPLTSYSYTVSAFDAAGNSSVQSSSASATTLADTTAPSTPTNLTATAVSMSQINLSWTAANDNIGVTGYKVLQNGVEIATATSTTYQNTGLVASTTYNYVVRATDAAGNVSSDSNQATATTQATPDTTPPSAPANLTATPVSSSQINLSWTASPEADTAGYRVFRNGVSVTTTAGTNYSDTGLTANTTYNYTVAAYDAVPNQSAQSGTVPATTQPVLDTTPAVRSNGAPTGILPSSTTATTLSLNTNESATCKYATVAGTTYSAMVSSFSTSNNTAHSAALSGLTAGQSYSYYVRCQDFASNVNTDDYIISFSVAAPQPPTPFSYERIVVDSSASTIPHYPWMKSMGDVNGDGIADLVVSGQYGPVVWYQTPTWQQHTISPTADSQSGSDLGDVDGDGDNDVVVGAKWYENINNASSWVEHALPGGDANMTHDILIADLNSDGKKDILMRGESSSPVDVYLQISPASWTKFTVNPGTGLNGLEVADINNDGKKDIVIGGVWMQNPGANLTTPSAWINHTFTSWAGYAALQAIDMNGDGRLDLVMSASEGVGNLSWFEQLANGSFAEHPVATGLNSVHRVIAEDVDRDGLLDIVASEYGGEQYFNIYRNLGGATSWQRSVLNTDFGWPADGLHNVHSSDINGDCKPDYFGAHDTPIVIVYRSTGPSACGPADTTPPTTPTGLTGSATSPT